MPEIAWNNSRRVIERIFITGTLILETPAHLGNGDSDALTDIPLLLDPLDGRTPLLAGSSIAGALRAYLRRFEAGYGRAGGSHFKESKLFGYLDAYTASVESWLMVDDAYGRPPKTGEAIEIRDGVAIDPATRTAEDRKKYDIELLAAGTTFDLGFELWIWDEMPGELRQALAIALDGLARGQIGLGMRKRRGYGRCRVDTWAVARYDMRDPAGVIGWLRHQDGAGSLPTDIISALGAAPIGESAVRKLSLTARFALDGPLLIRSNSGDANAPDMVHLRSYRGGAPVPILPGTTVAGVLRGRALRIAKTLGIPESLVDGMFGRRIRGRGDKPSGSRVFVKEATIQHVIADRVQNRVKIDRFTSGSYPQALFSEQPVWPDDTAAGEPAVSLELELVDAGGLTFEAEVGLILMLLKDLWTGDLPLGGESSIGRGRLKGLHAHLALDGDSWEIQSGENDKLLITGTAVPNAAAALQDRYVQALQEQRA